MTRAKDDGSLELTFKKTPDVDLHFVLSVPEKRGESSEGGGRTREVIVSARSLSAVGAEETDGAGGTKFMKSVKKLIRAHECQFNEEMFQKVCAFPLPALVNVNCFYSACFRDRAKRRQKD